MYLIEEWEELFTNYSLNVRIAHSPRFFPDGIANVLNVMSFGSHEKSAGRNETTFEIIMQEVYYKFYQNESIITPKFFRCFVGLQIFKCIQVETYISSVKFKIIFDVEKGVR